MKKFAIIGHYGLGLKLSNGQTIKTKIFTEALSDKYGKEKIVIVDTHNARKKIFCIFREVFRGLKNSETVVIMVTESGLTILVPFLYILNKIYQRNLVYVVIGAWLNKYLETHAYIEKILKNEFLIFAETRTLVKLLNNRGFKRIQVLRNCKSINILKKEEIHFNDYKPYKLCTFSRVMKEKGIEDAIWAVKTINNKYNNKVFELDIWGPVDKEYEKDFCEIKSRFPEYVNYRGVVDSSKSTEIVGNYFTLLFPTRFFTEGVPGTIIDAYSAGVPVISTKWESFSDIIKEGITGFGYSFENRNELINILETVANSPQLINSMRINCVEEAKLYNTNDVIEKFTKMISEDLTNGY